MGQEQMEKKKNITLGILAHVDAGKTTLSESILFHQGIIRNQGRVDHGNSFLDTDEMERQRGITIFSKQARFQVGEYQVTLLDTPGHVDFSAEMERSLQVLDYAILVVSAADGVQSHTRMLWSLLKTYQIPTFVFVNKMDQPQAEKETILRMLKESLSEECYEEALYEAKDPETLELVAMADEQVMDAFLEAGDIEESVVRKLILQRKIVPCFFGSALKNQGVDILLERMSHLLLQRNWATKFGARIFKIERDEQGNRLTHMKLTGGTLRVKEELSSPEWENPQKINQIRLYQGDKYELCEEAVAGEIISVTGLSYTKAGEGLGIENWQTNPVLQPVLGYKLTWSNPELSARSVLEKMRILEEENPELKIAWEEELEEIHVQLMGDVQIEVLHNLVLSRFGIEVSFSEGDVIYLETIQNVVEGVGHFEPLRHYAEAHLLLEPLPRGSGLVFERNCREDELALNWQRLILTHLAERVHKGVLIGAPITDMKISVIAGRAHNKHTEGGDFRQACYRGVRQGLMQAESVLLEPYFSFRIDVPAAMIGRVLTDVERLSGKSEAPILDQDQAILTGKAPVSTMRNYARELLAYTKGLGKISLVYAGYDVCHNEQQVIEQKGYDPKHDLRNTPDSVFCAHGSGFIVPWDEVHSYMHVESPRKKKEEHALEAFAARRQAEEMSKAYAKELAYGQEDEQLMEIFERTYGKIKDRSLPERHTVTAQSVKKDAQRKEDNRYQKLREKNQGKQKERYLLVDGYNIIFAWEELNELAKSNIDGARGQLMDVMCEYQGIERCHLILVFDAYKVKGNIGVMQHYHNIDVVYTKEAETADQYIEKTAHAMNHKDYEVTVATSDGLEQLIVWGQGCLVLSARQLKEEVKRAKDSLRTEFLENQRAEIHSMESAFTNIQLE